jgi:DNA-binding transcriptional ArsR family regulator
VKLETDFPDISILQSSASQACAMLKVLANEDRLLILCQLIKSERNVGELEALLGIRQPTLSQQLTVLREEGVVTTERKGKYIIYRLASLEVIQIMQTLYSLYCRTDNS